MDYQKIKELMIKESNGELKFNDNNDFLLQGLFYSYQKLEEIGLDAKHIIGRNDLKIVLPKEFHQYLGEDCREEELNNQYFKSLFCLAVTCNEFKQKKQKNK